MRAVLDIPESLYQALSTMAQERGSTLQAVILEAIQKEVADASLTQKSYRVSLPLIHSKNPGSLRSMTNSEIDAILD